MAGDNFMGQSSVTASAMLRRRGRVRAALRLCLGVVGAALIITGGAFLWRGFRLHAACREAETAEVLDIRVDVGATGRRHATLKQIAEFTCRQHIRMAPELREGEDAVNVLRGLELAISVRDAGGVERMTGAYPTSFTAPHDAGSVTIADSPPMPVGEYSLVVNVVSPAPALAGRPVRIVSGYDLCGIEWMGAAVEILGGAAAVAIGAIIGGALWVSRRRPSEGP
ncbi:MAG: hypothetical protein HUU22_05425 [Phycisphaerae bacterium]|nr:hypothetical protein [Phycisphaerae bacterium]NUQ45454.1 hypothetical protein [Phycisphaerae bacterium]